MHAVSKLTIKEELAAKGTACYGEAGSLELKASR
jgi:hypothetical protein